MAKNSDILMLQRRGAATVLLEQALGVEHYPAAGAAQVRQSVRDFVERSLVPRSSQWSASPILRSTVITLKASYEP